MKLLLLILTIIFMFAAPAKASAAPSATISGPNWSWINQAPSFTAQVYNGGSGSIYVTRQDNATFTCPVSLVKDSQGRWWCILKTFTNSTSGSASFTPREFGTYSIVANGYANSTASFTADRNTECTGNPYTYNTSQWSDCGGSDNITFTAYAPAPTPTARVNSSCTSTDTSNLVTVSWPNTSPAISYVDISSNNFSGWNYKYAAGSTSTNASTGFGSGYNVSGPLQFIPGTWYTARLWNGSAHSNWAWFQTPAGCPPPRGSLSLTSGSQSIKPGNTNSFRADLTNAGSGQIWVTKGDGRSSFTCPNGIYYASTGRYWCPIVRNSGSTLTGSYNFAEPGSYTVVINAFTKSDQTGSGPADQCSGTPTSLGFDSSKWSDCGSSSRMTVTATPDCNTNPDCDLCPAPANTCSANNGTTTCYYRGYTGGGTCNVVSFTQSCTINKCYSGTTCANGNCVGPPPTPSISTTPICTPEDNRSMYTVSWPSTSPAISYVDISTNNFASYSNKYVAGSTSTSVSSGFSNGFTLQPNTTYYVRTWNGSYHSSTLTFTTPVSCNCSDNSGNNIIDYPADNTNYTTGTSYTINGWGTFCSGPSGTNRDRVDLHVCDRGTWNCRYIGRATAYPRPDVVNTAASSTWTCGNLNSNPDGWTFNWTPDSSFLGEKTLRVASINDSATSCKFWANWANTPTNPDRSGAGRNINIIPPPPRATVTGAGTAIVGNTITYSATLTGGARGGQIHITKGDGRSPFPCPNMPDFPNARQVSTGFYWCQIGEGTGAGATITGSFNFTQADTYTIAVNALTTSIIVDNNPAYQCTGTPDNLATNVTWQTWSRCGAGSSTTTRISPPPPAAAPTITQNSVCVAGGYAGNEATISWTNPAAPVSYVDISDRSDFSVFWNKYVGGSSSTNLSGFGTNGGYWNGSSWISQSLTMQPGTKYYVRLWNGAHSPTSSFFIVSCTCGGNTIVDNPTDNTTYTVDTSYTINGWSTFCSGPNGTNRDRVDLHVCDRGTWNCRYIGRASSYPRQDVVSTATSPTWTCGNLNPNNDGWTFDWTPTSSFTGAKDLFVASINDAGTKCVVDTRKQINIVSPPPAPTNPAGSCPSPGTTAALSWTGNNLATRYDIFAFDTTVNPTIEWRARSVDYPQGVNCGEGNRVLCQQTNSASYSFSTAAEHNYQWFVFACNGSLCSTSASSALTCSSPPTAAITAPGDNSSAITDQWLSVSATANGTNLTRMDIHRARKDSDLTKSSSWTKIADKSCSGSSCTLNTTDWTPTATETGQWVIAVNAFDATGGNCSGMPTIPGGFWTANCNRNGSVSNVTVNINLPPPQATISGPRTATANTSAPSYTATLSGGAHSGQIWITKGDGLTEFTCTTQMIRASNTQRYWCLLGQGTGLSVTGAYEFEEAGTYTVTVNAFNNENLTGDSTANRCTGTPDGLAGGNATWNSWSRCQPPNNDNAYITVSVSPPLTTTNCGGGVNPRAEGLVTTPSLTGQFGTSTTGRCVVDTKTTFTSFKIPTYDELKSLYYTQSKAKTAPRSATVLIPETEEGKVFNYTSDTNINSVYTYDKTSVIFIEGSLNINANIITDPAAPSKGLVLVVKEDVNIDRDVNRADAVIISAGNIYTAGVSCSTNSVNVGAPVNALTINGSLISLSPGQIVFCRTLNDNRKPAEKINNQPKYLVILSNLFANTLQKWSDITAGGSVVPANCNAFNGNAAVCFNKGCSYDSVSGECR